MDKTLAFDIVECGDKRVKGKYLQANFLSQNQLTQFWAKNHKSKIKVKKGLTGVKGYGYAWAIVDVNEQKPGESIILFAAPAKPTDNAPPGKGWEAIGGVNPPPTLKICETTAGEALSMSKRTKQRLSERLSQLASRQFIYTQSAEIHGPVKGLYDYGPTGVAMKSNMIQYWRNHFVISEDMLEVESATLTPYPVLKASGHVDRFSDFVVKDEKTGDAYRADKLLENWIENLIEKSPDMSEADRIKHMQVHGSADAYSEEDLWKKLQEYGVKATNTGNALTPPEPFNLMFSTQIGPSGKIPGFMRPETAQGIFVNFKKLLEFNNGRVPFAAAQVGLAYRNEIAPRGGLVRVREFQQAEIEHFCGADGGKTHLKFDEVKDTLMILLPKGNQTGEDKIIKKTIGDAVADGTVSTQTLGYYLARSQMYYEEIGLNLDNFRFRQHKDDEMAHYARDCWDAEAHTTGGWLEIAGHADRACFDLKEHSKATGVKLVAEIKIDPPRVEKFIHKKPNRGLIGPTFKRNSKVVLEYIEELDDAGIKDLDNQLQSGDVEISTCKGKFTLTPKMLQIEERERTVHKEDFFPSVVEPSYGVGRIMVSLLEHAYWERADDESRVVLSLPPLIAPFKVAVLPLSRNDDLTKQSQIIHRMLKRKNIASRLDDSSVSIGRKYSRADEVGTPFACTIDFDTLEVKTVTIRERDSCVQIRAPIDDLVKILRPLCLQETKWEDLLTQYPIVQQNEEAGEAETKE